MTAIPSHNVEITKARMAAIFDEWAKRASEDPDNFQILSYNDGSPKKGYGERATTIFFKIGEELDAKSLLPVPDDPEPDSYFK